MYSQDAKKNTMEGKKGKEQGCEKSYALLSFVYMDTTFK